ncbi:T9SS type A sorting domain-containing protein [Chitinophaga ginsengisoli]|uniref:Putative secreted protein (Por secretion system target) n=1 Tax=Chitinophaga ginsengisoli TaxID=363837 RepID=A0A2P8G9S5_9BACT|nr:T9SS type A sorting domain-containing protein [Chitinophaga ginsengisoli]PSL30716.1 putative secreted protein (Por secretion system target) [Chitinophaga ginsengisoli]
MIKRALFLLLLPLLVFTSRLSAQNPTAVYELTVKCDIMGFGTATCGSLYEVYAIMDYGGSRLISSGSLDGIPDGTPWYFPAKTITFTSDNMVKGIAVYGKRKSSCSKTQESKELDYMFPAGDRTCFSTRVGGMFAGYHSESTLFIDVKPVSKVYELQLQTTEVYPGNVQLNYNVTAHYTDGTQDEIFAFISTALQGNGDVINRTGSVIHSTPKTIASIEVSSEKIRGGFWPIVKDTKTFPVSHTGLEFDGNIDNPFVSLMDESSKIHVTYKEVVNDLVYDGQGSYILPTDAEIKIIGTPGIPNQQYLWQYLDYNGIWQNAPANKQGSNVLQVSARSLFGNDWEKYLAKHVLVRMLPACAQDRPSAMITLECRLEAPHITSIIPRKISCNGANDGGFTLIFDREAHTGETINVEIKDLKNVVGGTKPNQTGVTMGPDKTYTWPLNTLPATTYRVKVTGDINNTPTYSDGSTFDFQLDEPTPVIFSTPAPIAVKCYDGSDGGINLNINGGAGGYVASYKGVADVDYLTQPFTANTITGLAKGDYLIKVKDQNGCAGKTTAGDEEMSFSVKQPDAPLGVDATTITDPKAFGYTDGSITVHLKGGTPKPDGSYDVEWRKADGTLLTPVNTVDGNGIYTTTINNQPDGDYTLTVTDGNYNAAATNGRTGCTLNNTFKLTQPPPLVANIQITDSVSCNGKSDGTLTAIISGGMPFKTLPHYTYEWYQITNGVAVSIGQTDSTAVDLPAGLYLVKATDANGISILSDTTDLVDPTSLQVQFNTTPATCYDGSNGALQALVSGGTTPYRYNWSNGSQQAYNPGLHAGTYTVNITDYHGCPLSGDSAVEQPAAPLQIVQQVLTQPLANGYSDGSIKILLQGGTANADGSYNVSWQKADGTPLGSGVGQVVAGVYENVLSGIPAGDYKAIITDAQYTGPDLNMQGCTLTGEFPLKEPPPLVVTIAERRYVSCKGAADGVLAATADGGVRINGPLPYRFAWYKKGSGGYSAIGQTTPSASGLTTGIYKVIITDANNIDKTSDSFLLVEPDLLQVQLATTPVTCASGQDGAVTTTVSGGTGPFRYEWTNGETTSNISNLTEGSYLVFVTDARGCEAQNNADVFIPNGIVVNADITAPICAGSGDGAINAQISGGIPPYRYEWSNGATTNRIDQLKAGKYILTVQDANNCKRVQTFNLPDPTPLQVLLGADKTLCNSQTYTINAAIADPAATYTWGGEPAFQATTPSVTLNQSGQYWVSVMDGKGCIGRDTINIQQLKTDISAEFVVSTQVFRNEEVSLINISTPVPERTVWEIPTNKNITVLQNTPLLVGLRFADTGVYHITLHSYIGSCEQVFTKEIAVLEQQSMPAPGGAQQPFITSFEVSPNPNNGQFTVRVTLDKAAEIRLRLFNIISNQLVNDRKESAAAQFNINYQLNITAGTYVLLLETPLGNVIRKIIITQ